METPPADYDIVVLPLPRWDGDYSSTILSLSKEFAKSGHRTFYLDNPYTLKDLVSRYRTPNIQRRKKAWWTGKHWEVPLEENLVNITTPLTFPVNFLPRGIYDSLQSVNSALVSGRLQSLLKKHDIRNYIFINSFNPMYRLSFPKDNPPMLRVYHCVDNISESLYIRKHGTRLEDKMISEYDLCAVTSKDLYNKKRDLAKSIAYIPNAADTSHFEKAREELAKPADFPNTTAKVICYVGNIEGRMDVEMMHKAAMAHSDLHFLLIGPVNLSTGEFKAFSELPNVSLTGPKAFDDIPAYLRYTDCTLIPFKVNELTKAIYPLKINEYLAAGKPVVSTAFSEDIESFSDIIYLARNHEEFSRMVKQSVLEDTPEKAAERVSYARNNDWSSRASSFLAAIQSEL